MSRGTREAWFPDYLCHVSLRIHFALSSANPSPFCLVVPSGALQSCCRAISQGCCLSIQHVFLGVLPNSFQSDPNFCILPLLGVDFYRTAKAFQGLRSLLIIQKCSKLTRGLNISWGSAVRHLCGQTDSVSSSLLPGARLKNLTMILRYCDFQSTAGESRKGVFLADS